MKKILIIGAGVVGLSIAYELSKYKKFRIIVLEKGKKFGLGNTFKNSQVIHSGVYYKKNSLKNILYNNIKKLIYKFFKTHKIKIIKIVFSVYKKRSLLKYLKNGVKDVKLLIVKKKKLSHL